ncbi:MAG: insulinase family protein [Verrucomicrobiales bacterium]|nr:insulinase family protein [Verrucomicrobiales bacterium]
MNALRHRRTRSLLVIGALALAVAVPALAQDGLIDIPYKKFVLKNGLTLVVHEDHKAPIVAVNVWYHVGSKNEKEGRTGFAHLFEHLMFNGSEHYNDDYFQVLQRIGATGLNGTTNFDRTNYFQNVPTSALDVVLWMESDRMGHLLGAIDQAKLDEQRGVVQNEKRQGENQPYGRAFNHIFEGVFPEGHPYSWSVIGSMEDLSAAKIEDVHAWFKGYYGAANAVIVIAGDIDAEIARQKVEKYFGSIPSGPPITKMEQWIPRRSGETRQVMQDRVPQSRIYKVWVTPEFGTAEADYLDLAADVLASGKSSRLYKRLVYDDQIATNVFAFTFPLEIAGIAAVIAEVRPGGDAAKVEQAIDEEMARFLQEGPTEKEMARVKSTRRAGFVRGVERIGGFGGKSDVLAQGTVYAGDPGFHLVQQKRLLNASAGDLLQAGKKWFSDGAYVLEVHPFKKYETAASDVDRSKVPEPGQPPEVDFPPFERATLSNGLKVIVAERHSVPQVNFNLIVDAGYAADHTALAGTASMAMTMLDEGTKTRNSLQISDELALLGAQLGTGSDLDVSTVFLSALRDKLDASLDLYADVILNPSFPSEELERQRPRRLAQIQQEGSQPQAMAMRVLPKLLYGDNHAYGTPLTGSGFEETVKKMTREDLVKFHQTWFKPNNATLVVVGDTTLAEIRPKLEKRFAGWQRGEAPKKNISPVERAGQPAVYIMDRPGAIQSVIMAAHVAPPRSAPNAIAIETMNNVLGATFVSRINMNLREDKHWSYGARSTFVDARAQRPFLVVAPVQTDKTKESMAEVLKELTGIRSTRPATAEELAKAKKILTLSLAGRWETMNAVANSIGDIVTYGLRDDYWQTYAARVNGLTLAQVNGAADGVIHPDSLVWVVVGDREKIEEGIRALNFGAIRLLDPEGNVQAGGQ